MGEQLLPETTAAAVAERMVGNPQIGTRVLDETIAAATTPGGIRESGRTWCSSDDDGSLREPLNRYPAAVDLAGCPPGDAVAVWHTHTDPAQLRNPEHSLPDVANVAFGRVDASIIPGVETDHVLVAAADREQMRTEFRNVLGADVDGAAAVTEAIQDGRVSQPASTRDRLNAAFEPLIRRIDVDRPDLEQRVDDTFDADTSDPTAPVCDGTAEIKTDPTLPGGDTVQTPAPRLRGPGVLRREARITGSGLRSALDEYDITGTVVGTAVGMFTSRALERAIFGE